MRPRTWACVLAAVAGLPLLPAGCLDLVSGDCHVLNTCSADGGAAGDGGDERGGEAGSVGSGAASLGGSHSGGSFEAGGGGAGSSCDLACAGAESFCDEDVGLCIECATDSDCGEGRCDVPAGRCTECLDQADCGAGAPVCAEGVCTGCSQASDCGASPGRAVCEPETGACVECVGERDCDGNVCAPALHRCTELAPRMKFACEACEYDAECQEGQLCVAQTFEGAAIGNFCAWTKSAYVGDGTCSQDGKPFALLAAQSVSVDGATDDLCVLRTTSCLAYAAHSQPFCTGPDDDAACGAPEQNDALCELNLEAVPLCTYACGSDVDCKIGFSCTAGGYCSL